MCDNVTREAGVKETLL